MEVASAVNNEVILFADHDTDTGNAYHARARSMTGRSHCNTTGLRGITNSLLTVHRILEVLYAVLLDCILCSVIAA